MQRWKIDEDWMLILFSVGVLIAVGYVVRCIWQFFYVSTDMPWELAFIMTLGTIGVILVLYNVIVVFTKHR